MDWSSDIIKNIYNNAYKDNLNKDYNGDGKVDSKDKEKLFENSDYFKFKELTYDDLIKFSETKKKDVDENGTESETEKSFLSDLKNFLYENIAKNINRKADLSLDELLELETTVRNLKKDPEKAEVLEDVGNELERIQNRMISNITSQFFVTGETTQSYKDATVNKYAEDVWENLDALSNLNASENNPFNAKMETLLEKLDKKVIKTLSESYSAESIQKAKEARDTSILEEKTDPTVEPTPEPTTPFPTPVPTPDDYETFEYEGKTYVWKYDQAEKIYYLYQAEAKYTGKVKYNGNDMYFEEGRAHTGEHDGLYYIGGFICTGIGKDGHYYKEGVKVLNGKVLFGNATLYIENGEIKYQDKLNNNGDTERTIFSKYKYTDADGNEIASKISKVITFVGTNTEKIRSKVNYNENGEIESTETYTYTSDGNYIITIKDKNNEIIKKEAYVYNAADGTYTVTIKDKDDNPIGEEIRDKEGNVFNEIGFCYFNGKLYENGKIKAGEYIPDDGDYKDKLFINGVLADGFYKDTLYLKGEKFTGIYEADNLYYFEGKIEPFVTDAQNNLYVKGILAQGIYTYNEVTKYYENGKEVPETNSEIIELLKNIVSGAKITLSEDGTKATVTGCSTLYGLQRAVTYDIVLDSSEKIESYTIAYNLAKDVAQKDIYSKPEDGDSIILTGVKYILKGKTKEKEVEIENINGAQDENKTDYTIAFNDADGFVHGNVNILIAKNDNMTEVTTYSKDADGNFQKVGELQTAFASIGDIQAGKPYEIFDSKDIIEREDGYTVVKDFGGTFNVKFIYDNNGKFNGAEIRLAKDPFNDIKISATDLFSIDIEKKEVIIVNNDDNTITIFDENGNKTTQKQLTPELKTLANNLGIDLTKITDFDDDEDDGEITSITIDGIIYAVQYNEEENTISLSNETQKTGFVYKEIDGKYVLTSMEEPIKDEETQEITGSKVTNKDVNGVIQSEEIKNNNGDIINIYEYYENGKLKKETRFNHETDIKTEIEPMYDTNGNITKIVVTETDNTNNTVRVTKYTGDKKIPEIEILTYNESGIFETTWFDSNGYRTNTEVKDEEGNLINIKYYDYNTSNKLSNTYIYEVDNEGNIKTPPSKIINAAGAYAKLNKDSQEYEYFTKDNKPISAEQLNWANALGVLIGELIYDKNDSEKVIGIKGLRYDHKPVEYTNYSYSETTGYTYTETLTLSTNATEGVKDDIILVTEVKDNIQKSAKITVDGNTYNIYTDKATAEDKLDYAISTMEADDYAHKIFVYDVLFDGLVRQRTFKRNKENGYDVAEILALATIEDLKDDNKKCISFEAEEITENADGSITLTPNNKGEIIVNYGKYTQNDSTHSAGDYKEAYKITLPAAVTLIVTKTTDGYEIKDSSGAIYEFKPDDGGFKITKNGETIEYDNKGKQIDPQTTENPPVDNDPDNEGENPNNNTDNGNEGENPNNNTDNGNEGANSNNNTDNGNEGANPGNNTNNDNEGENPGNNTDNDPDNGSDLDGDDDDPSGDDI